MSFRGCGGVYVGLMIQREGSEGGLRLKVVVVGKMQRKGLEAIFLRFERERERVKEGNGVFSFLVLMLIVSSH